MLTSYYYYIIFCIMMIFSPGPMTLLLMNISIEYGMKKTFFAQIGASSAYFISLLIFSVGLTALIQQHTLILKTIQYAGVLYILYLAYKQWQNARKPQITLVKHIAMSEINHLQLYYKGLITGISNPKTIVMFSTVIPQFAHDTTNKNADLIILSLIFLVLQALSGITYSYFGQKITKLFGNIKYQRIMYNSMCLLLILVAVMIAKA